MKKHLLFLSGVHFLCIALTSCGKQSDTTPEISLTGVFRKTVIEFPDTNEGLFYLYELYGGNRPCAL